MVYCVVVQGTSGGYDWLSNFNIGSGENHAGFYLAHEEIMTALQTAMEDDEHNSNTWIVCTRAEIVTFLWRVCKKEGLLWRACKEEG